VLSGCDLVRNEGVGAVDNQDSEKMEAIARGGRWGEAGPVSTEDGVGSYTPPKNLLESVKATNIGITSFGFGLHRCDSTEL
jgi:hypothetical protein